MNRAVRIKRNSTDVAFDMLIYVIISAFTLSILYPLYFVVIASFSSPTEVLTGHVWFYPRDITLKGYTKVFHDAGIWTGYCNTILYVLAGTFISLAVTLPAAYSLSRKDFSYRNKIMVYFIIPMFFSGGLIPTYLLIQDIQMVDTFWVMVLPFSVNVFYLIITRTFFQNSIPKELQDAAFIDGCSNIRFFFSVVLPLSKAIIAVIGLYCAVGQWNEYFRPLIYLRNSSRFPLQIILMDILVRNDMRRITGVMGALEMMQLATILKYALIVVATVPIMAVYPFIQKYFTKGVMIGSIKG